MKYLKLITMAVILGCITSMSIASTILLLDRKKQYIRCHPDYTESLR